MSVCENLDGGLKYRPNVVRSVHKTEVKIVPYGPNISSINKMFITSPNKKI